MKRLMLIVVAMFAGAANAYQPMTLAELMDQLPGDLTNCYDSNGDEVAIGPSSGAPAHAPNLEPHMGDLRDDAPEHVNWTASHYGPTSPVQVAACEYLKNNSTTHSDGWEESKECIKTLYNTVYWKSENYHVWWSHRYLCELDSVNWKQCDELEWLWCNESETAKARRAWERNYGD